MKLIVPEIYNNGNPVAGAVCRLQIGATSWISDITDIHGECILMVDNSLSDSQFEIQLIGFQSYSQHVNLGDAAPKQIRVGLPADPTRPQDIILPELQPNFITLPRVVVNNKDFLVNGQIYKMRGFSDFLLLFKKANGIDIKPLLSQRKLLGCDTLRIFTMCYNIQQFDPRDYDIYNILSDLLDEMASYRLRGYIEGFADRQFLNMDDAFCQSHHNKIGEVLKTKTNAVYDLANEYEKNGIDPSRFERLPGVVCSSGSRVNNYPPAKPYWDFVSYHPRRDGDDYYFSKWLTDIPNQAEVYYGVQGQQAPDCPISPDEPRGFGYKPGRINDVKLAYTAGWLHTRFQNSAFFHCDEGIMSEPLSNDMWLNGVSFFKGCDDALKGV